MQLLHGYVKSIQIHDLLPVRCQFPTAGAPTKFTLELGAALRGKEACAGARDGKVGLGACSLSAPFGAPELDSAANSGFGIRLNFTELDGACGAS
jgi:hypothetical protein